MPDLTILLLVIFCLFIILSHIINLVQVYVHIIYHIFHRRVDGGILCCGATGTTGSPSSLFPTGSFMTHDGES
mgnify:CR=1 FL=1